MRNTLINWGALLLLAGLSNSVQSTEWLVLSNMNLIDGTGAEPMLVPVMTVKDGEIVAIGGATDITVEPMDRVTRIDLGGAWVMPGLIDTHVHVARFPDTHREATRILKQAVRGGVTTVRDLGGDARTLAEINRALGHDEWIGPTVAFAGIYGGPSLFEADERISRLAPGYPTGQSPWTQAITAETDIALAVAASRGAGMHAIKLYGNLDVVLSTQVIAEARNQGLPVWAHAAVFPTGPGDLVDAGVRSLSHAAYLVWEAVDEIPADYSARTAGPWDEVPPDHPKLIALYQKMAAQDVYLDATLYVYRAMHRVIPAEMAGWVDGAAEWGTRATAEAHRQGVKITTGTDWFEPGEGELPHTHEELVLLVEQAGLSPMEAIVAATGNSAGAAGVSERRGTLEAGKMADIIVLDASPLEQIQNTQKIRMVIKDGRVIDPSE